MSEEHLRDVTIVGGGAGGLACATACAKAGLRTALVERLGFGGQMMSIPAGYGLLEEVPNFGPDYAGDLALKMMSSGVDCRCIDVDAIEHRPGSEHPWHVSLSTGPIHSRFLVAATGAVPQPLDIEGAQEFRDNGICYCAPCDGPLYANGTVAIIADDRWAIVDALCLADVVARLFVIGKDWDRPEWGRWRKDLFSRPNVTVIDGKASAVRGGTAIETVIVEIHGHQKRLAVDAVFAALGTVPVSALFAPFSALDGSGRLMVDEQLQTRSNGLFAVGDVRTGSTHTATGAFADSVAVAGRLVAAMTALDHHTACR